MEGISIHVEHVLEAARTAPSHDNLQPWRFVVDDGTISFAIDHERASPDGTMARIGVGAALECACIAAARAGAAVRFPETREGALVTMSITDPKRVPDPDLSRTRRVTNRRVYDGRPVDDAIARSLREATPPRGRVQTQWFGRERVRALGPLLEEADELLFLDARLRERSLSPIRFDAKERDEVSTGLSVGSLELSTADRATLTGLRKASNPHPAEAKKMGARARRLVESASGVCIITAGLDPMDDVDVGRSMQRAWMALTQRGLAAQPMTTMMTLSHVFTAIADGDGGRDTIPDRADAVIPRATALLGAFRGVFPNVAHDARIAFLMRFGFAEAPSCRVGRLPLEAVTTLPFLPPP
jgi:nitroreductase